VKRLRIKFNGERLDLLIIDDVTAGRKALADCEVFQVSFGHLVPSVSNSLSESISPSVHRHVSRM
jgi:hypothetical protein